MSQSPQSAVYEGHASPGFIVASYCDGHLGFNVDAADEDNVAEALSPLNITRVLPLRDDAYGCRVTTSTEPLLDADRDGEAWIESGLFLAAYRLLKRAGFHVMPRPPSADEVPKLAVSRTDNPCALALAHFINSNQCGTLWLDEGVKVLTVLALIIRLFPEARIVIATQHEDVARHIYNDLCRRLPRGQVRFVGGRRDQMDDCQTRVYVGRYFHMGFLSSELIDLFVPVDVQFLTSDLHEGCLRFPFAKTIGIDFATRTHAEAERLQLARRLGFASLAIRHIELRQRPTVVFVQPAPVPPAAFAEPRSFDAHRDAVECNRDRNHLIAALARFMHARHRALPPRGIVAGIAEARRGRRGPRVLIVVEGVDHAITLAGLLPQALLRFARSADLDGLESLLPDFQRRLWIGLDSPKLLICTTTALRSVVRYRFDTIIMASGRRELPSDLWRLAYAGGEAANYPLTVIEVAGPQLRRRTSPLKRLCEYAEHTRWQLRNIDQTDVALRRLQHQAARSPS